MERLTYPGGINALLKSDRVPGEFDSVCFGCRSLNKCAKKNRKCYLFKAVNRLAEYENMQEKVEKRLAEIKASSDFPHNFTGQMAEDFEWVLNMLPGGKENGYKD